MHAKLRVKIQPRTRDDHQRRIVEGRPLVLKKKHAALPRPSPTDEPLGINLLGEALYPQ